MIECFCDFCARRIESHRFGGKRIEAFDYGNEKPREPYLLCKKCFCALIDDASDSGFKKTTKLP